MFRLNNLSKLLIAGIFALSILSCMLIDLSDLTVQSSPRSANDVMQIGEDLQLSFSEYIQEDDLERILTLTGKEGEVDYDLFWDGKTVTISPLEPFIFGERYAMEVQGIVSTRSNAEKSIYLYLPFYYGSNGGKTYLSSYTPASGSSIDTSTAISFTFSDTIDTASFDEYFSLSPNTEFTALWTGNTVTITPVTIWENLNRYDWSIPSTVLDSNGIRLPVDYSGSFLVQLDPIAPEVLNIFATNEIFVPAASTANLNDIAATDWIAFEFSKAVDESSARTAIEFSPSMSGQVVAYSETIMLFKPEELWDPYEEYEITVSTALKDTTGLPLVENYTEFFTPDGTIPQINVNTITGIGNAGTVFHLVNNIPQAIELINSAGIHAYTFVFNFSHNYNLEYQTAIEDAISITPELGAGNSPRAESYVWSGNSLTVLFSNWPDITDTFEYYFQVKLAGGKNTINQDNGYIKEDIIFYVYYDHTN
jgi:hypothetical protein